MKKNKYSLYILGIVVIILILLLIFVMIQENNVIVNDIFENRNNNEVNKKENIDDESNDVNNNDIIIDNENNSNNNNDENSNDIVIDEESSNTEENGSIVKEENIEDNIIDKENNIDNTNNNSSSNNESNNIENESTTEKSLPQKNKDLVDKILNTYRVSILYDDKADFYYNSVAATKTTEEDALEVYDSLVAIERGLNKMPQSVLDTLRLSNGYNILLFKELPQGQDGLAVITTHVYQILLDVDNWKQERIFYHETFHIMERYMYLQNGSVDPFPDWNSYNPADFVYGEKKDEYLWIAKDTAKKNITFTSSYAQINSGEDRAEIFEDLMDRPYKYTYMNDGYGINEKAKYLSNVIEKYFSNISKAPWDEYISW